MTLVGSKVCMGSQHLLCVSELCPHSFIIPWIVWINRLSEVYFIDGLTGNILAAGSPGESQIVLACSTVVDLFRMTLLI